MGDRTALYARISEDPLGLEKGVTRQIDDGRAFIESRGWEVTGEYVDNDLSALCKRRPQYEALMVAVERDEVDRIVTYMQSRLWRNRRERAEAIELLRARRVGVVCVKGPELDLSSATGRMLAGLLGEFDTHESEVKGERVARAAEARARAGQANGAVLYGWRREYDADAQGRVLAFRDLVDKAEAAVVREILDRLLDGEALRAIASDLNRRGVLAPQGGKWAHTGVRKVALRPANVARRMHNGADIGPAAWAPLVTELKHSAVTALLTDPNRRHQAAAALTESGAAARKYLLTYGVGECGVCGSVLRHATKRIKRKVARERTPGNPDGFVVDAREMYLCEAKGCVGRNRQRVDELVSALVVERLSCPDALDLLRPAADDGDGAGDFAELRALRGWLDDAADDYSDGVIDREQLRRITVNLRPRLEEAETALRSAPGPLPPELRDLVEAGDVLAAWQALTLAAQRGVLDVLCGVILLPTRQGAGFDPASVRIAWRDGDDRRVVLVARKSSTT